MQCWLILTLAMFVHRSLAYLAGSPARMLACTSTTRCFARRRILNNIKRSQEKAFDLASEDVMEEDIVLSGDKGLPPLKPITIKNTQKDHPIDIAAVRRDIDALRTILKLRDFSVDVLFCSDAKIQRLNRDYRGKNKPTDILSFPIIEFSPPEVPNERTELSGNMLGDLIISPAYVWRQCEEDRRYLEGETTDDIDTNHSTTTNENKKNDDDNEEDDSRGVSRAMYTVFDLNERISLLLVHGFLHLLGYDHETPSDWQVMAHREEEVLAAYRQLKEARLQ